VADRARSTAKQAGDARRIVTRWGIYDLRICPPSFDFLTFLVLAKYHGATDVWFVPGVNQAKLFQYDAKAQQRRVETILYPACRMYGMGYKVEPLEGKSPADQEIAWPPFAMSGKALDAGYGMGWLKSIKEPEPFMPSQEALNKASDKLKGRDIVVHMRVTPFQTSRNSSADWDRWAVDHNAYVLADGIELDERCAFHELAKLNMGVVAGPMTLSTFSTHRPYILLKQLAGELSTNEAFLAKHGWYKGSQYPWAGHHQLLVWNDSDDYQSIEAAYRQWLANNPERNSLCQKNNSLPCINVSATRESERGQGKAVVSGY
jgi:hypothetical protein